MTKQTIILAGVAATALNLLAQDGTIILADFQNPPLGGGTVNGTQRGLVVNLPEGNWIWAKGWNWGPPSIWSPNFANGNEGAATGLSLASTNAYVKPSLIQIHAALEVQGLGGMAFWSEMTPLTDSDLSPHIGATGIQIHHPKQQIMVVYNDGTTGPAISIVSESRNYALDYTIDTASGELLQVLLNGARVDGLSSSAFTNEATQFAGFLTRGNVPEGASRISATAFSVSSPEIAGLPWIVTRSVGNITPESANLRGFVGSVGTPGFTVNLCYGESDGADNLAAWTMLPLTGVNARGAFNHTLEGLDANTRYYFRFHMIDAAGKESWSPFTLDFLTLGAAVLGEVTHAITPEAVTLTANVIEPGFDSSLTLNWGTQPGALIHTQSKVPVYGSNTFDITTLPNHATCYYEIILSSIYAAITNSGSFHVSYTYLWQGGDGVWSEPANWDIGLVPHLAGDIATIVTGNISPDLSGMNVVTLGQLDVRHGGWVTTKLLAHDNTQLCFDNNSAPALINFAPTDAGAYLWLQVPVRLDSPTRVRTSSIGYVNLFRELSGDEPLILEYGRLALSAEAGDTLVIRHPIISGATGETHYLHKHGAGTVVLRDGVYSLPIGADWSDNNEFIHGGGTFVFDNTVFTNRNAYGRGYIFGGGDNNQWHILNGSRYVSPGGVGTSFSASYATLLISGAGSSAHFPQMAINASHNTLRIEDGGTMTVGGGFSFDNGLHNTLAVGNAALNLNGQLLHINGLTNTVTLAAGGVITNGNVTVANSSRLQLAGGLLACPDHTVQINDGGILAPVLSRDGILPVNAQIATLAPGSKIVATNLDNSGKTAGQFPLITAATLTADLDTITLEGQKNFVWRLSIEGETLLLTCYKQGAFFMLR